MTKTSAETLAQQLAKAAEARAQLARRQAEAEAARQASLTPTTASGVVTKYLYA